MVHVFGIRHHGPGSAKSLQMALAQLAPDCLLIEGPPDANGAIEYIANPNLIPPVALLVYNPSNLKQGAYFPFAHFSPEWQALQYGIAHGIPTEFMDLPRSYAFALDMSEEITEQELLMDTHAENGTIYNDPFGEIAKLAGYQDSERWWEITFERSMQSTAIFDTILELMTTLRAAAKPAPLRELQREAYMRTIIRAAVKKGFQKIAVICGAWHAPVLDKWQTYKATHDKQFLKGIKKTKTKATWVPWTYKRLSSQSGYAAGVISPAWYQLLFDTPKEVVIQWMTKLAQLLRKEDVATSSAHVIEAVRLAESLAAIRSLVVPGIQELSDAAIAILFEGDASPLALIEKKLIVGERIGEVPDSIPIIPLQQDLQKCIKSARLTKDQKALEPIEKVLDLRKATNLLASHLLHRLRLLGIPWGQPLEGSKYSLGSFKEHWLLEWEPDFAIRIIEMGMWGNTIYEAAANYVLSLKDKQTNIAELTKLVEQALFADLQEIIEDLLQELNDLSAISKDLLNLMDALPSLVNIVRYGSVRNFHTPAVLAVLHTIIPRICISLPNNSHNLDEAATQAMFQRILAVNRALHILNEVKYIQHWYLALAQIMNSEQGQLSGLCTRILSDKKNISMDIAATKMSLALSKGNAPLYSAQWLEGFLNGSGLLLIYNESLWQILDNWVERLKEERFMEILPVLRRAFSQFSNPEREKMLNLAKQDTSGVKKRKQKKLAWDEERAGKVVPLLEHILGL